MTLTELKYIVAVARERHFARAAAACFVSQPTLSVAIKKLEDELDLKIFERGTTDIKITALGEQIVAQALRVLDESARIKEIAKTGKDPLSGPLSLGVIYTVAPYVLPQLMRQVIERTPQMPLILQEDFTASLLEMLRTGELDCALLAEPFEDSGLASAALYDEPFIAAVPSTHAFAGQERVSIEQLQQENLLLLGAGHCFRDHVLSICSGQQGMGGMRQSPLLPGGDAHRRRSFVGSSLETIKHMVAAGMGVTVVPQLCAAKHYRSTGAKKSRAQPGREDSDDAFIRYLPLTAQSAKSPPTRRIALVWRRSFTRYEAIAALRNAIVACAFEGVLWLQK